MLTCETIHSVTGRVLRTAVIEPKNCPHAIWDPDHYREDGSCKCDDKSETVLRQWGYRWSRKNKRWE